MSTFRFYYQLLGDHYHIRVFAGLPGQTFAKCGDLVMRSHEWETFTMVLRIANSAYTELIDETPGSDDPEVPR